jgi:hypothetical protein
MRQLILTLLLMFLFTGIKAQSLEETKTWILSKLNKYQREWFGVKLNGDCDKSIQSYNFKFKFEKDTLIVTNDVKVIFPQCYKGDKTNAEKNTATKLVSKIPIFDIAKISSLNYGIALNINSKLETIRSIATFSSGDVESYSGSVMIGLNLNTEDSLLERLQKAFTHLQTFYPKHKKTETF